MNGAESKPKRGRPPVAEGERKASTFSVRLTKEERAEVDAAAKRDGGGTSEWARRVLLATARAPATMAATLEPKP